MKFVGKLRKTKFFFKNIFRFFPSLDFFNNGRYQVFKGKITRKSEKKSNSNEMNIKL